MLSVATTAAGFDNEPTLGLVWTSEPGAARRLRRPGAHLVLTTSAFDDVDGQAALRCLLVLRSHVGACLTHRLDHLVEAKCELTIGRL